MQFKKRIPFLYLESGKIYINNKKQLLFAKTNELLEIKAEKYVCIVIGKECEISNESIKMISQHRTLIAFTHHKMGYVLMTSYNNKRGNLRIRQLKIVSNKRLKLAAAKQLIRLRNKELPSFLNKIVIGKKSINEIMLYEARWTKQSYRETARITGQIWLGRKYALKRQPGIFIINRLLYTLAYLAIVSLGLDPSLGIIHNHRSGMGLAFDIADIFKPSISWMHGMSSVPSSDLLFKIVDEKQIFNKMIKIIETIFVY